MAANESTVLTIFEAFRSYVAEAPTYHIVLEVVLVAWIMYLLFFSKQYHPEKDKNTKPTKQEEEELIRDWQPEPLVPDIYPKDHPQENSPIVSSIAGTQVTVDGKDCINLSSCDFYCFMEKKRVQDAAANSIKKYGVGSCGPRGFFGTVDVHVELEKRIADFTLKEDSVLYSFGFAAVSSTIPAYSKRNDIIFCDDGVCFSIQKGLTASRSTIKYFKHNDMNDLERLLEEQKRLDIKNPAKAKKMRKFIVAEGLYVNSGDLVPLPKLVEFRNKYRVPIILEESLSLGVLGKNGRGVAEHFNIPADQVDLVCASMHYSMGCLGGFSAGKAFIVQHQRLSGIGYCFSASIPPLLASSAIETLEMLEESPEIIARLKDRTRKIRELLSKVTGLKVCGMEDCPMVHVQLMQTTGSLKQDQQQLESIVSECLANGLALSCAKYLENEEQFLPSPSIRVVVSSEHSDDDLTKAAAILQKAVEKVLQ